jgi:hypothetical protein
VRLLTLALILANLSLHAARAQASAASSAHARAQARFKNECDNDGRGKSCYDYARSLWSDGGHRNRALAKKYLWRGCELKFQLACETYHERSSYSNKTRVRTKSLPSALGPSGPCFTPAELDTAKFYPNMISATSVHGQLISNIAPKSFWDRVGFIEGDVIVRINNRPFNKSKAAIDIFASSAKKFSFQVERNHETITLWYTCE